MDDIEKKFLQFIRAIEIVHAIRIKSETHARACIKKGWAVSGAYRVGAYSHAQQYLNELGALMHPRRN